MTPRLPAHLKRIAPTVLEVSAIALLALPMLIPLLRTAEPETHDALIHFYRAIVLAWHLGHGDLFPRLSADLGYGFGLPVFNFYGPLFYYPPALLILLGLGAALAVNLTLLVIVVLAGWGTLQLGREWFGGLAGWIAAAAFLYSPYFLLDLYWRGDFPEVLGLALLPWGLLFFTRLVRAAAHTDRRASWLGASATTGLVALAHNIGIVWSLPMFVAAIGAGWLLGQRQPRSQLRRRLSTALMALAIGLALSAFFLLPAVAELNWIQASRLTNSPQRDYRNNFLAPAELVALPVTYDPSQIAPRYPRSLGLAQLGLAALGLALVWREPRNVRWLWLGVLLVGAACAGLALAPSAPIWAALPPLKFIQFPWRWLGPASLMLALLAGFGLNALLARAGRSRPHAFSLGLALLAAGNLTWAFATYFPPPASTGIDSVRDFERASGLVGLSTEGEFVPVWVSQMPAKDTLRDRVAAGDVLARVRPEALPPGLQLVSADYRLTSTTARFMASAPALVTFDWFYFPGWTATVNNQPVPIHIQSPSGQIAVAVPAGASEVRLVFGTTADRVAGGIISLLGLLALVAGLSRRVSGPSLAPRPAQALPAAHLAAPPLPAGWGWAGLSAIVGLGLAFWRVGWVDRGLTPWMQIRFADAAVRGVGQIADVPFGDQLALLGWDPPPGPMPAGDTALINLYWRALQPLSHDYSITLRLLDDQGLLVAQADSQHPGGTPTSIWPLDRYDLDPHRLVVPPGTPPGRYRLLVGAYHIENGQRLEPLSADGLPLPDQLFEAGTLQVGRPRLNPSPGELGLEHPIGALFGPIRLLGADPGAQSVRPGDDLLVTTYWQSIGAPSQDDQARFELTDAAGAKYPIETSPVTPSYPTSQWTAGETLRGTNRLRVPAEAAPGAGSLSLALMDPGGTLFGPPVPVATLTIQTINRSFVAPAVAVKSGAMLGGLIELAGTSALPSNMKRGEALAITLDWHVIGRVAQRYTIFVHLLDASGAVRAQVDSPPLSGARPTSSWLPGEYLADPYRLSTPPDLPPGLYQVEAGMYLPETGERLLVTGPGASPAGTRLLLGQVDIGE